METTKNTKKILAREVSGLAISDQIRNSPAISKEQLIPGPSECNSFDLLDAFLEIGGRLLLDRVIVVVGSRD
jgi:hypothetical protein